jgi:hypothetical protein
MEAEEAIVPLTALNWRIKSIRYPPARPTVDVELVNGGRRSIKSV